MFIYKNFRHNYKNHCWHIKHTEMVLLLLKYIILNINIILKCLFYLQLEKKPNIKANVNLPNTKIGNEFQIVYNVYDPQPKLFSFFLHESVKTKQKKTKNK